MGTGSFGAFTQQMACNAGMLYVYYDETDAFKRVHEIAKGGSDAYSLTLSAYDCTPIRRLFMNAMYSAAVEEPHLVLHVSAQPKKYTDIFGLMVDSGGAQRFLISKAEQRSLSRLYTQASKVSTTLFESLGFH